MSCDVCDYIYPVNQDRNLMEDWQREDKSLQQAFEKPVKTKCCNTGKHYSHIAASYSLRQEQVFKSKTPHSKNAA